MDNTWISSFSIVLGFLIGSSNSTVIGAALSSIFGVIIAILSLIETDIDKRFKLNYNRLNFTGKILFTFSALLFVGVISGDNYRNDNISLLKEQQVFPWGNNPPESTFEAFDWIVTSQKLRQIGYSKEQINSLYIIREKEILKFKNTTLNDLESEDDVYGFDEKTEAG